MSKNLNNESNNEFDKTKPKDINSNAFDGSDSIVQQAINQQIADMQNNEEEDPYANYNDLALYFREDFIINVAGVNKGSEKEIHIKQPTIQDYINLGEDNIYSVINPFTQNTTSVRVQLWDMGKDWNKISDWELFMMLTPTLKPEYTNLFFSITPSVMIPTFDENGELKVDEDGELILEESNEINFSWFEQYNKSLPDGNAAVVLYSPIYDIEIDEQCYIKMRDYMRYMFKIFPEEEFCSGKRFKQEIIDAERLKQLKRKQEKKSSNLLSLISFCVNHPGFKYKTKELKEVGIIEFMDSVQRLQIYESTRALHAGSMSGFCDTSKIDKELFNFMRPIKHD